VALVNVEPGEIVALLDESFPQEDPDRESEFVADLREGDEGASPGDRRERRGAVQG